MRDTAQISAKDYVSVKDGNLNYFEIAGRGATEPTKTSEDFADWAQAPVSIEGFDYIPFGSQDDIPNQIIDTVYVNHMAPRIQNRKVELLIEQGPYLYRQQNNGQGFERKPVEDTDIQKWLDSLDFEEILHSAANDYYHLNLVFHLFRRNLGGRIGMDSTIATVEHLNGSRCRLAYRRRGDRTVPDNPTHVIVGDFKNRKKNTYKVYPIWDRNNPTRYPAAVHYTVRRSFGVPHYAAPEILGALNWINNSTTIPRVLTALTENALNIKWHIQSPAKYWDDKRQLIKDNLKEGETYSEKMLDDLKQETFDNLSKLLSGVDNVGKFWHNEYVITVIGGNAVEMGWKITPIEQKIKDYIEAQLKRAAQADRSVLTALGLHGALANVGADGKSDSGSEQLYALTNHQRTSVMLPEYYVCKALNDAIKIKFETDIKIGFYHMHAAPLQEQNPNTRMKTQEPTP